jgi:lantibiotic modifying enzyme
LYRSNNPNTAGYIKDMLTVLEKIADKDSQGGLKWLSVIDIKTGEKAYNLALSHGLASIIGVLSKIIDSAIETTMASRLLENAVTVLLNYRYDPHECQCYFPNTINDLDKKISSRVAWCYGDLGIASALWQASQTMKNKEWQKIAEEVLLYTAGRRDLKQTRTVDAGICHGTAGNAHLFNRAYQNTGYAPLKDAANFWLEQTLKMASFSDGFAGFKRYSTPEYGGWQPDLSFLEGISGIGLVIISAMADIEPQWDRILLLS